MYVPFKSGEKLRASRLNIGLLAEVVRTSTVGTFTAETVLDFITFTADANSRYTLWCSTSLQSSVANDSIDFRFRYLAGGTLTTSGTEFHHVFPNADVAGKGQWISTMRSVTGLSGQYSIGVTAARSAGTGNIQSFGSAGAASVIQLYRD